MSDAIPFTVSEFLEAASRTPKNQARRRCSKLHQPRQRADVAKDGADIDDLKTRDRQRYDSAPNAVDTDSMIEHRTGHGNASNKGLVLNRLSGSAATHDELMGILQHQSSTSAPLSDEPSRPDCTDHALSRSRDNGAAIIHMNIEAHEVDHSDIQHLGSLGRSTTTSLDSGSDAAERERFPLGRLPNCRGVAFCASDTSGLYSDDDPIQISHSSQLTRACEESEMHPARIAPVSDMRKSLSMRQPQRKFQYGRSSGFKTVRDRRKRLFANHPTSPGDGFVDHERRVGNLSCGRGKFALLKTNPTQEPWLPADSITEMAAEGGTGSNSVEATTRRRAEIPATECINEADSFWSRQSGHPSERHNQLTSPDLVVAGGRRRSAHALGPQEAQPAVTPIHSNFIQVGASLDLHRVQQL